MDVIKTDITPVTEPVELDEVKTFLSIDLDTEEHDSLLTSLITTARQAVETYTGLSLVDSSVVAQFDNIYDNVELPYGPVKSLTSVVDYDGDAVTDYKTTGLFNGFVKLAYVSETPVDAAYLTGYVGAIPEALKTAIKKKIATDFEQRTGFDVSGKATVQVYPNDWKAEAAPYSRKRW